MQHFTELPTLSLYIHIPWCVKKCPYCDFNSHVTDEPLPEKNYVNRLLDDLDLQLHKVWGRSIHSITEEQAARDSDRVTLVRPAVQSVAASGGMTKSRGGAYSIASLPFASMSSDKPRSG